MSPRYPVSFLLASLLFLAAAAPLRSAPPSAAAPPYRLRLVQIHTGESLDVVYRIGDQYQPAAIAQLNYLLRDYRTGAVKAYDPREFDLLHDLLVRLGRPGGVIDVVCGYRSPATNQWLRVHTAGVAQHSRHMLAQAIDLRVPGVPLSRLRAAALALHRGGVGYYPASDFVHVDVGPVRRW